MQHNLHPKHHYLWLPNQDPPNHPAFHRVSSMVSSSPGGGSFTITVANLVDAITTSTQSLPGGGVITAAPRVPGGGGSGPVAPGGGAGVAGGVTPAPLTTSATFTGRARREIGGLSVPSPLVAWPHILNGVFGFGSKRES